MVRLLSGWYAKRDTPSGYREYRPNGYVLGWIVPHQRGWWRWDVPDATPAWGHVNDESQARGKVEQHAKPTLKRNDPAGAKR